MNLILSRVFCLQKLYKFTSFNCSLFNIEQQQDSLIGDGLEGLYWTVAGETLRESIPVSPHLTILHTVETSTIGEAGTLQNLRKEKPSRSIKRLSTMDKRRQTSNAASCLVLLPSLG